ncbi:MAG: DUF2752 domain-containing protein [Blastocatellia bacterium]|nr:DUF2752 domain-containing protein [Blastocatellia bacterium]
MIEVRNPLQTGRSEGVRSPRTFSPHDRTKYLLTLGLSASVLFVARSLEPSSRGVGTHEQMGLPPCPFLHFTGFPCPSCGLTTSFAHAAHLDFYQALVTQPVGLLTFLLTVASIPFLLFLLARRVRWEDLIHSRAADRMIRVMIALYALGWLYKIIIMKWPRIAGW